MRSDEPLSPLEDERWMRVALDEAQCAAQASEVPVGAVLVSSGQRLASAHNRPIALSDPSAHAEILVLRQAGQLLQNYRLVDTTLYVTLEPCMMCVGALIHARVARVVFGAYDPKSGALGSQVNCLSLPGLNHRFSVRGGVLEPECRALLQSFFRDRRTLR